MSWLIRGKKRPGHVVKVWVIFSPEYQDVQYAWVTIEVPFYDGEAVAAHRQDVAEQLFGRDSVTREGFNIGVSSLKAGRNPEEAVRMFANALG